MAGKYLNIVVAVAVVCVCWLVPPTTSSSSLAPLNTHQEEASTYVSYDGEYPFVRVVYLYYTDCTVVIKIQCNHVKTY